MFVKRPTSRSVVRGDYKFFTGNVWIEQLVWAEGKSHITAAIVTFEPRSRTAWHAHPLGQLLIVVAGCGLVQKWGEDAEIIQTGDIVWIPPDTKHWHGATDTNILSHIAIQEASDGRTADWMEHISDEQYESALKSITRVKPKAHQ
ncbi:MAG: cupin domain-containing protein [Sulfolobales archaeon]|nr:cupin domain-containing protein [Ignisphaera sp.]MCX8199707.1 cupin domain-containing protein [Sulfolobales archaeon]MDW8085874.1 cupin domain-containing protein [Ignisphaera sp.]